MSEPIDPTSDDVLNETMRYCTDMLHFLRLREEVRAGVYRHLRAAQALLGGERESYGYEPTAAVYETAHRLAESVRRNK